MDVDEPQSLILVVSHKLLHFKHPFSIIRIETSQLPPQVYDDASSPPPPPVQTGFSAHIPYFPGFPKEKVHWEFSVPPASSPEDLYMLPDWTQPEWQPYNVGSLPGIIFNLSTKKCKLIKPPQVPKCPMGYAVTMGDHIYFMAQPNYSSANPGPRFERYDTLSRSWVELEAVPPRPLSCRGLIVGSAVLDDTILLHMGSSNMLAYNVSRNKWYTVKVLNDLCGNIVGKAVVLNNIIYALTSSCQSLLTLTLANSSQENDDGEEDLVYTCDLLKEYVVPVIGEVKFELQNANCWSRHLVHLGKDNFCVVRTCAQWPFEYLPSKSHYIQLAYVVVSEKKLIVTNICVHEFKIPRGDSLDIIRCFSMPNCKSNAIKEATRLINPAHGAEVVNLPPELVSAPSKAITTKSATKASTLGDVAASGRSNTDEEGNSITVGNLPLDFSFGELVKKFGRIKSVTIHPNFSHMMECHVADVEFESSTAKQNAIKAGSLLTIGGRTVVIEEKKGTGLARGDSTVTSGWRFLSRILGPRRLLVDPWQE